MKINYTIMMRFMAACCGIAAVVWIDDPVTQFILLAAGAFAIVYYGSLEEHKRFLQALDYRKAYHSAEDAADNAELRYQEVMKKVNILYTTSHVDFRRDIYNIFGDELYSSPKEVSKKKYSPNVIKAWSILGVEKGSTKEECIRAFRKKARDAHPDNGGDENSFKELNWAKEILGL